MRLAYYLAGRFLCTGRNGAAIVHPKLKIHAVKEIGGGNIEVLNEGFRFSTWGTISLMNQELWVNNKEVIEPVFANISLIMTAFIPLGGAQVNDALAG